MTSLEVGVVELFVLEAVELLLFGRIGDALEPVSYTHLDVYKRQGYGRAVGNQVDFARDHYGAAGVAGERHGSIAGGIDRVGGIDAAHAAQIGRQMCIRDSAG